MSNISIALADVSIRLAKKKELYHWVNSVIESEKRIPGSISVILCSDKYLLGLNKKFLKHNYYTDIITFNYGQGKLVSGELFISIDRLKENADKFKVSLQNELNRVIIHGILHLCGYNDKTASDIKKMKRKENQKLKMLEV